MVKAQRKLNTTFELMGKKIEPIQHKTLSLESAKLVTDTPVQSAVEVFHGQFKGPRLLVCSTIHGDELNGIEIIRQLMPHIDLEKLAGTVILVPIVNPLGLINKSRYLPDRRDLNRCFPGSKNGSLASRVAFHFFDQIVQHVDAIIDLHTAAIHRTNLPQIRGCLENYMTLEMAKAFATPIIVDSPLREGSLRAEAEKLNIPVLTYEAGEALRFDPIAIQAGLRGILNVMQNMNMLKNSKRLKTNAYTITNKTQWIRATHDGIFRTIVSLGEFVEKGQTLAYISSPLNGHEAAICAPKSGIIIGQHTLPFVYAGDALFHVAYFKQEAQSIRQDVHSYLKSTLKQIHSTSPQITTGVIAADLNK